MKNIRFIYNQYSLDSKLAAIVIRSLIETTEVFKEGCNYIYSDYNRIKWSLGDQETDYTFILGCELEEHQIAEVDTKSMTTVVFSYINGTTVKKSEHVFQYAPNILDGEIVNDIELVSNNSICMLVNKFCKNEFDLNVHDHIDIKLIELINSVHLYSNHMQMSKEELNLLYSNYDEISDNLEDGKFFVKSSNIVVTINKIKRIQTARGIIDRNFEKMLYGNSQKNITLPTVQVGEEYYHDVARLLSFPYNEFITYEDVRYWRLWKITAVGNPKRARDIASIIEHRDSWFENTTLVLLSESPR